MIIVMRPDATESQIEHVVERVRDAGFDVHLSKGVERSIVGVKGVSHDFRDTIFRAVPGVEEVIRVLKPYKLASREFHPLDSEVALPGLPIGGKRLAMIAGPCSVENDPLYRKTAEAVKASGANCLRGGAFKPRSSPYSFQGLGEEGLKIMRAIGDDLGLPVITEATNPAALELVVRYADAIQIGARNMQNYDLLREAGNARKPVLLKRGMAATIQDLLLSAEYILHEGNENVILCERGIRTFEDATRNTMDVSAVPVIKELSHLPVVVDPSHAAGHRQYVLPLALAAVAAGCDGLMVEVHAEPEEAMSDGEQSLLPGDFSELMDRVRAVAVAVGREI